jgi:translation initiation factor 1
VFAHSSLSIQQRSGRKTLTTVQGIDSAYDLKKLVKALKKEFACNGCVVEHPEFGEIMQLQGDQRNSVARFLVSISLAREDQVLTSRYHAVYCVVPPG